MKKAEKQLASARQSAATARENASTVAMIGAFAPIGAAYAAQTVLPMLPGPTEAEFAEAVNARKGATSSKRVLILGGVTAGLVFFGGSSWEARAAAAVSGGLTGAAITMWNGAALAIRDPAAARAMVLEVKK